MSSPPVKDFLAMVLHLQWRLGVSLVNNNASSYLMIFTSLCRIW